MEAIFVDSYVGQYKIILMSLIEPTQLNPCPRSRIQLHVYVKPNLQLLDKQPY